MVLPWQVFLMMMCTMEAYVFTFFGAWLTIGLIFTVLLIPETQGVPIEKVRPQPWEPSELGVT